MTIDNKIIYQLEVGYTDLYAVIVCCNNKKLSSKYSLIMLQTLRRKTLIINVISGQLFT